MLIRDIVTIARRILGDTKGTQWTNERMLDIVNSGLRDINKHIGVYRSEHFFELQQYRYRYPMPTDLLEVTSIYYDGNEVELYNRRDKLTKLYATKDQLNRGILEIKNIPIIDARPKRFFKSPIDDLAEGITSSSSSEFGVLTNQLTNQPASTFGVTSGAVLPASIFDNLIPNTFGILSEVHRIGDTTLISTSGSTFGVLTSIDSQIATILRAGGTIGEIENMPYRIAGRYGTVVSVLKSPEYIHVMYKAITQELTSLEVAFPLSYSWIDTITNWIVGTALQDDNDANNNQRAIVFLGRYSRDLDLELRSSNRDYSSSGKKYTTKYNGGINNG